MLSAGRALIGLGVSAGLMGSIKAFTLWFPRERLTALAGWMIGIGSPGVLSATAPLQALLGPFGWRALFVALALLSFAAALLIFFVVPERELPRTRRDLERVVSHDREDFARLDFWRLPAPLVLCQARRCRACGLCLGSPTFTASFAQRQPTGSRGGVEDGWRHGGRESGTRDRLGRAGRVVHGRAVTLRLGHR
jgi:MFS family permease